MKRILWLPVAAFAVLALAPAAWAQDAPQRPDPEQRAERMQEHLDYRVERLALTLDLSDNQKAQIRQLLEAKQQEHHAEMQQRREARQGEARPSREERRAQMEARRAEMETRRAAMAQEREATDAAIRNVLTPEQAQKFDALRALDREHRAEMRAHRGERMQQRGDWMKQRGQRMQHHRNSNDNGQN